MVDSFLFYDLEIFGQDSWCICILQFVVICIDVDFNEIDMLVSFFVWLVDDLLFLLMVILVIGIILQQVLVEGISEVEVFDCINEQLLCFGICVLGYNMLCFDDEFVCYGLFCNFYDFYECEWCNGNLCWDLLDMLCLMWVMWFEGIQWLLCEDGVMLFKFEYLVEVNKVCEGDVYEVLLDVCVIIGMVWLFK